jgi:hypothetical protein
MLARFINGPLEAHRVDLPELPTWTRDGKADESLVLELPAGMTVQVATRLGQLRMSRDSSPPASLPDKITRYSAVATDQATEETLFLFVRPD